MDNTSRHLVDPELGATVDKLPDRRFTPETLDKVRREIEGFYGTAPSDPAIEVERITIAPTSDTPPFEAMLYRPTQPATAPRPALLFFHSGGFVCGSAVMMDKIHRQLALALDAVVVSPEYRLAPEHPHPAPVEDCYATLEWAAAQADTLDIDPARIALCGSSAGSGLAAAVALKARDEAGPAIVLQYLVNPMLDDRTCTPSDPHPYAGEFVLTPEDNRFFWHSLLGRTPGGDGISEYAAPSRATDLAGLPPAFLSVGSLDLFVEEAIDYARRLIRAGVPTELHVYPGGFHGSAALVPDAAISRAADGAGLDALRRALSTPARHQEPN